MLSSNEALKELTVSHKTIYGHNWTYILIVMLLFFWLLLHTLDLLIYIIAVSIVVLYMFDHDCIMMGPIVNSYRSC